MTVYNGKGIIVIVKLVQFRADASKLFSRKGAKKAKTAKILLLMQVSFAIPVRLSF
jgi:hypothetical protein